MLLTIVPMLPVWQSSPSGEAPQDRGDQPRMGVLRLPGPPTCSCSGAGFNLPLPSLLRELTS